MNSITNSLSYQLHALKVNIIIVNRLLENMKNRYKSERYKNKVDDFKDMIKIIVNKYELMLSENEHYNFFKEFSKRVSVVDLLSIYYDITNDNEFLVDTCKELEERTTIDSLINDFFIYSNKISYLYIDDDIRYN